MPDPTAIDAFTQATKPCAGLKTLTAELRLSGRAGGERIRGTLLAGLRAPAALRFEAVAPFGPPVFILAGRDNRATLLLPRDTRVLPDAAVAQLLERLTGLALAADDLRLILTGCLVDRGDAGGRPRVANGGVQRDARRRHHGVSAKPQRRHGRRRRRSRRVAGRLCRSSERLPADRAHSQRWVSARNRPESPSISRRPKPARDQHRHRRQAFAVDVPPGAVPMTLDDLRAVAPLRGSS